ncbi:MAG: hypothetical protein Q3Y17_19920, partial [Blautia sp.]|nr:hypothetical protein [Blautia sp.]
MKKRKSRIWKNRKRIICILLCCITLLSSFLYVYESAEDVQAFFIADDAVYLAIALMAACGTGYIGYEWYNSGAADDFADQLAKVGNYIKAGYDNIVKQAANASGQPDPDDSDPDNDDPNEKFFSFDKLKLWFKAHPNATVALQAGGALATVVGSLSVKMNQWRNEGTFKDEETVISD